MDTRRRIEHTVAAIVTALLLAQASVAQPGRESSLTSETVTRTIDIAGFDLSSPPGARRLYRQIVSTAKSICWSTPSSYEGVARAKHQNEHGLRCFDEAVSDALEQVIAKTGVDIERVAALDRFDEAGLVALR